jgi:hypothetical protein
MGPAMSAMPMTTPVTGKAISAIRPLKPPRDGTLLAGLVANPDRAFTGSTMDAS